MKEFSTHSHIVAIKTSGRVYSYDAIKKLSISSKTWADPTSGEPFTKSDIITLQSDEASDFKKPSTFYHVKHAIKWRDPVKGSESVSDIALGRRELETIRQVNESIPDEKKPIQKVRYTDAASFTSSGETFTPTVERKIEQVTEKKGYVQLVTSMGTIDLELHCDLTPKTCENFLTHCTNGYYDGIIFHRCIKEFMVQGGDPSGTGMKGESIWGGKFEDEIVPGLRHDRIGILSMANSGKDTNGSQFFITFKSARHLDGKHTVFGKVIDNMETLKKIEQVQVDASHKPIKPVVILRTDVVSNPLEKSELENETRAKLEAKEKQELIDAEKNEKGHWFSNPSGFKDTKSNSIGKYLNSANPTKETKKRGIDFSNITQSKKPKTKKYGDFSKW